MGYWRISIDCDICGCGLKMLSVILVAIVVNILSCYGVALSDLNSFLLSFCAFYRTSSVKELEKSLEEANKMVSKLNTEIVTLQTLKKGKMPQVSPITHEPNAIRDTEVQFIEVRSWSGTDSESVQWIRMHSW